MRLRLCGVHVNALLMRFRDLSTRDDLLCVYVVCLRKKSENRLSTSVASRIFRCCRCWCRWRWCSHKIAVGWRISCALRTKRKFNWNARARVRVWRLTFSYTYYASSAIKPGDYVGCRCIVSILFFFIASKFHYSFSRCVNHNLFTAKRSLIRQYPRSREKIAIDERKKKNRHSIWIWISKRRMNGIFI